MKRALCLLAAATLLALAAVQTVGGRAAAQPTIAIFYYPWYGTPLRDGDWQMWTQNDHQPPADIYSAYFPARGVYSSSDAQVRSQQLADIAGAGVDELVASWWGRGTPTDRRLPGLLAAARKRGLLVAAQLEPYSGRTAQSAADDVRYLVSLGIGDVYVYSAELIPAQDWAAVRATLPPVRLFAQTAHVGFAAAARFDGVYTYDIVGYPAGMFARYCAEAHRVHLLCAPSVGPGYDALKADGDWRLKPRRDGATYDAMWSGALGAASDVVTITSYNEWGEGTQIEPAQPRLGYESYNGAWGRRGGAAERAYLGRTAFWAARFQSRR